jgi:hypothetical protein
MFAAEAARRASHTDVASTRCPKGGWGQIHGSLDVQKKTPREERHALSVPQGGAPPSGCRHLPPLRRGREHILCVRHLVNRHKPRVVV